MRAWSEFLEAQEALFGKKVVDDWLRSLRVVRFDAGNLFVETTNPMHLAWIEEHLRFLLKDGFPSASGRKVKFHLTLQGVSLHAAPKLGSFQMGEAGPLPTFQATPLAPAALLDLFVTTKGSFFAREILQKRLPDFNPFFLHGPEGSGKSHLLMGLTRKLQEEGKKAIYVNARNFTEDVVRGMQRGWMRDVRAFYRSAEVLLIDDIDYLSGKHATQEEFFHTFNTLHGDGRTVILSSRYAPALLEGFEPRLVSRFEWGITLSLLPIDHPDELKEMLTRRLAFYNITLPPATIKYLPTLFDKPERLGKAIDYIWMLSSRLGKKELSEDDLKEPLEKLAGEKRAPSIERIVETVSELFGLAPSEIASKSQNKQFSLARMLCMYLLRKELRLPYLKIGKVVARDHSTVITGVRQIHKALENKDRRVTQYITDFESKISAIAE